MFEGYALPHAIQTLKVAGQDITEKLMKNIQKSEPAVTDDMGHIVRQMKEQMCKVSDRFEEDMKSKSDDLS